MRIEIDLLFLRETRFILRYICTQFKIFNFDI